MYLFKPVVFDFIKDLQPSPRGELEITHAIQRIIESKKYKITYAFVNGWWDDAGTAEAVLHANQMMLQDVRREINGTVKQGASITGNVSIGTGSIIGSGVIINGPAVIGDNCIISGKTRMTNVSIGDRCKIHDADIELSIVMEESVIETDKKIINSLIGKRSKVIPTTAGSTLIIGEDSEVSL